MGWTVHTSLVNYYEVGIPDPAADQSCALKSLDRVVILDQPTVVLRFNDFRENGAMRIDNLLISGTAIPEPTSVAFLSVMTGLTIVRRRRRHSVPQTRRAGLDANHPPR